MTRVLIADDHPLMLSGIASLLGSTAYEVVAQVTDGSLVVPQIEATDPEIAILDISMPGARGIDIVRELRGRGDDLKLVLLTAQMEDDDLLEALRLNVDGIVHKNGGERMLVDCLDTVIAGGRWVQQDLLVRAGQLRQQRENDPIHSLTAREREITDLVRQGLRNAAIAEELGLTEGTVKVYLNRIYEKLGIASRIELALLVGPHS
jgi:two-component system, NarL family, nitrate/nitrite response regulator NarL